MTKQNRRRKVKLIKRFRWHYFLLAFSLSCSYVYRFSRELLLLDGRVVQRNMCQNLKKKMNLRTQENNSGDNEKEKTILDAQFFG